MKLSRDIQIEIENLFKENHVSFFCGAGISFNSGIPIVDSIIMEILETLLEDKIEAKELHTVLKQRKRPFEAFMQTIINLSGDDQLLDIFKLGLPNSNHLLIAHCCKIGILKQIYTTNFDILIENAFKIVGLEKDKDYLVFSNEKEFKKGLALIKKNDYRIKLFKLHGSIHDKTTIRTTLESIGRNDWLIERSKVIQYAFSHKPKSAVIIQGYSFSDYFDINTVLVKLKKTKQILCVEHNEIIEQGKLSDLKTEKLNVNLTNTFTGKKLNTNNSQVTEFIWRLNNFSNPSSKSFYEKTTTQWRDEIYAWRKKLLPSLREYIIAQIYFDLNKTEEALKWNLKAKAIASKLGLVKNKLNILYQAAALRHRKGTRKDISIAKKISTELFSISDDVKHKPTIASSINMEALILMHNEGNHIEAKKKYEISLPIFREIQDKRGEAITLLSIGSCYRHAEDFVSAIDFHNHSLQLRKELGDFQGMSRCYQGLGNIFLIQNKIEEAYSYYELFKKLTEQISDVWGTATAKYKLAECLLNSNNADRLEEAIELCNSSLEVRASNKNREYADCLFLRAQLRFKKSSFEDCRADHMEVLRIRNGNKEHKSDIADSYFEIGNLELKYSNIKKAFSNYMKALRIYIKVGYKIQQQKVTNSIIPLLNQVSASSKKSFNLLISQSLNQTWLHL